MSTAHDLRSPLNTVGVMAELLERQFQHELGAKGHELISYITSGIGHLRRLLEDLLAFARASHFEKESASAICLDARFDRFLKTYRPKSKQRAPPLPPSRCPLSPSMKNTLQLFQNLINNAIKYHSQDGPLAHMRADCRDSEWIISVTDNGRLSKRNISNKY